MFGGRRCGRTKIADAMNGAGCAPGVSSALSAKLPSSAVLACANCSGREPLSDPQGRSSTNCYCEGGSISFLSVRRPAWSAETRKARARQPGSGGGVLGLARLPRRENLRRGLAPVHRLVMDTWDCKYHVVFIPKYRRSTLYQELRRHLGEVFRKLAHRFKRPRQRPLLPLRAAQILKPPALPGDTYFGSPSPETSVNRPGEFA